MKKLLTLLVLSVGLVLHTLFYRFQFSQGLILVGILLGIVGIFFAIKLLMKKQGCKAVAIAVLSLCWGLICAYAVSTPIGRGCVRFVIKKYYLDTYNRERIYFAFKDYVGANFNGKIAFDENWRQVLADSDWYIKPDTFTATERGNSFLALNSNVLGKNFDDIAEDTVLFFEMDNKDMAIGTKEDFLSQDWNDDKYRLVILANGRECKYYKARGGSQYFNTKTQKPDYEPLKWQ